MPHQPSDTHMDLNIGTAFWFAARGEGYLRTYTHEEVVRLCGATTTSGGAAGDGGDGGEDGGSRGDGSRKINNNKNGRPLLRHGAAGAAAGVGKPATNPTRTSNDFTAASPAPQLVELSCGKFKCLQADCTRVYKHGCVNYLCKKCCDVAHRCAIFKDASSAAQRIASAQSQSQLLNACPAHKPKQKQEHALKLELAMQLLVQERQKQKKIDEERNKTTRSNTYAPIVECESLDEGPFAEFLESTEEYFYAAAEATRLLETSKNVAATANDDTKPLPTMLSPPPPPSSSLLLPLSPPPSSSSSPPHLKAEVSHSAAHQPPRSTEHDHHKHQYKHQYERNYRSRCKVLLVGLGADEQMAGYGRHRTVYMKAYYEAVASGASTRAGVVEKDGFVAEMVAATAVAAAEEALRVELNKDLTRLWKRNLGR